MFVTFAIYSNIDKKKKKIISVSRDILLLFKKNKKLKEINMSARMDGSLSAANSRWAHNKAFIQQTADPENFQTMPPSTNHPSAVYKKVTIDNSFTVPVIPTTMIRQVEPGTGLILWFPKLGVDSILHQGIIPKGTVCTRESGTSGYGPDTVTLTINSLSNSNQVLNAVGPLRTGVTAFVFTRALSAPRLDAVIKITPNLGQSFSQTRAYGGIIRCWSDTVAAGNLNLTGTTSASVISDTRDICQNKEGTDAYAWADINQAARTVKEGTKEVTIMDGVCTIQGSDIPPDFESPDALNDVRINGGWDQPYQFSTVSRNLIFSAGGPVTNPSGHLQVPIFSAWYSPYGVNQEEGCGNTGNGVAAYGSTGGILPNEAIPLPILGETSTLKVKFDCKINGSNYNYSPGAAELHAVTFDVVIEHFFVGIANSYGQSPAMPVVGAPNIRCLRTVHSLTVHASDLDVMPQTTITSQLDVKNPISLSCVSDIEEEFIGQGGAALFGKFFGCKVFVCARAGPSNGGSFDVELFSYDAALVNGPVTDSPADFADQHGGPQISFFASEINYPGTVGPCHIIRYDAVGQGQQVRINGMLNTESVAKGSLAPYVQDQVMNARIASDVNVLPLIWMLYNGASEFKMSWIQSEYDSWRMTQIRHMTAETLNDLADGDSRVKTSMEAAGLFSGIIGGLGNAIGGTLDSVIGASGQYGASAAAQYGMTARGQFGASGQFGEEPKTYAGSAFHGLRRARTM